MLENDIKKLVFLDESDVNTDMARHYARSKKHERAAAAEPLLLQPKRKGFRMLPAIEGGF